MSAEPFARVWQVLAHVPDPEIPAVSVVDLGIVRSVDQAAVHITPTYTGCPATLAIEAMIRTALDEAGLRDLDIVVDLSPPWTTDWISDEGREKLRAYGIAPPGSCASDATAANVSPIRLMARNVDCPRCGSAHTERLAAFGSTACKSLYRCIACREPFEYFKPI